MAARILVVEDDVMMARLITKALERAGHQPLHADGAARALAVAADEAFDLVVMDLFLPDGDGLAICQHLRAAQDVPVVMVSSLEQELGERMVGMDFGPHAFLAKPFNFAEFVGLVDGLLAGAA